MPNHGSYQVFFDCDWTWKWLMCVPPSTVLICFAEISAFVMLSLQFNDKRVWFIVQVLRHPWILPSVPITASSVKLYMQRFFTLGPAPIWNEREIKIWFKLQVHADGLTCPYCVRYTSRHSLLCFVTAYLACLVLPKAKNLCWQTQLSKLQVIKCNILWIRYFHFAFLTCLSILVFLPIWLQ